MAPFRRSATLGIASCCAPNNNNNLHPVEEQSLYSSSLTSHWTCEILLAAPPPSFCLFKLFIHLSTLVSYLFLACSSLTHCVLYFPLNMISSAPDPLCRFLLFISLIHWRKIEMNLLSCVCLSSETPRITFLRMCANMTHLTVILRASAGGQNIDECHQIAD